MAPTVALEADSSAPQQLAEALRRQLRSLPAVVSASIFSAVLPLELSGLGESGPL